MIDTLKRISDSLIVRTGSEFKIKRSFYSQIEMKSLVCLLIGLRGIGKTTSILQYLGEKQKEGLKVLYVSADNII